MSEKGSNDEKKHAFFALCSAGIGGHPGIDLLLRHKPENGHHPWKAAG
jgi:hypothetical protein